jgi:hypothetical protein
MVRLRSGGLAALGLVLAAVDAAPAQQPASSGADNRSVEAGDEADYEDSNPILVTGQRQRGAVTGDIPPIQQLNGGDVRALGVNSVAELLDELAPQTRSGQGRGGEAPVTLLNGRRISGFREIRDIPTEAIERVDILPEEVALKYGYSANQRVVNIVLRRRFRAITGEVEGGLSTRGGAGTGEAEINLLHIRRDQRLNVNVEYEQSAAITEADRNLISRSGRSFDAVGNVEATTRGAEIDPALSILAGQPVTVAGVPANAASGAPALSDFVAGANRPNSSDVGRFRTIRPRTRTLDVNSVYSRTILDNVAATLNANLNVSDSDSLRGLPGSALQLPASNPFSPFGTDVSLLRYLGNDPLTQASSGWTGHLGFSLDKDVARWKLSLTGNYDHVVSRTRTWRGYDLTDLQSAILLGNASVNPFGSIGGNYLDSRIVDRARSTSDSGDIQLVANGPLLDLPAGPLNASVKGGFSALGLDSRSTRSGILSAADLSRTDVNGRVSLDLPLTSRRNGVLPAIGDLSINVNAAVDRYSDFGALGAYGYGTTWKPRDGISLIFSMTHDRNAPSVQQLGNPQVLTPDVRTYDYLRGVTVDIAQLGGGNPDLLADRRRVMKLGLTLKPFKEDVTLSVDYVHSRIRNAIAGFPEPTPAIAAAFADRFVRDEDGDLIRIDARAVNFDRQEQSQLRWGLTFTKRLKTAQSVIDAMRSGAMARRFAERRAEAAKRGETAGDRPAVENGTTPGTAPPDRPSQAGGPQASGSPGGGPGFRGRGGGQGGRLQFSVFHTWHLKDEILIRRGLPVLDLLDGDAIGATGGTPRHELEAQFTYSNNGLGLRLTGNWQQGTTVNAAPGSPTGDLRFGSLAKVNARLFVNLAQIPALANADWAQGARVSLRVDNLFDTLPRVRDATGATPSRYQGSFLDPVGRAIRIEFRKAFF